MSRIRRYSLTYSNELYEFLCENASSHTIKELVIMIKEQFNIDIEKKKLAQYCLKMKITYKLEKPNKSHSNQPTPIGIKIRKTDGNYIKIKIGNHKWKYLQRKIYEDNYGVKLPEDVYVIFLDQNRRNFDIKNLKAISRRESAIMAKDGLFSTEPRITKLGHLSSKMNIKAKGE